ncbi:MAG: sugar ABC transporter permease [Chloroflexi bacterium]|nr:sugar ABC transporter permease [Chloroflexota bacterium]
MSQGVPPVQLTKGAATDVPGTTTAALPGRRGFDASRWRNLLIFLGPALVLIAFFTIYPAIRTIYTSFTTQVGIGVNPPEQFVGWQNYQNLWQDFTSGGVIRTAVINNILWMVIVTPVTVVLGVIFAVLLDRVKYEAVAKAIVFVPMAISATAAGVIWKLMYADDPHTGVINAIWTSLPGAQAISFLGNTSFVNYALMGAQVWMGLGFAVVVLSAALKAIPKELTEAAKIDGANELDVFWRITVPLMWPTITVIATLTMIGVLKIFDIIYTMTSGGPAGASEVLATRMYVEAFKNVNPGYGSAIAVVLLVAVIPLMAINIRRFQTEGKR